jgi:hypothetical protein
MHQFNNRKKAWVVVGVIAALVLVGCGEAGGSTSTGQSTPTTQPTATQGNTSTSSTGGVTPTAGDPLLFGPLSNFYGKYGNPNSTNSSFGSTTWELSGGISLTVFVFTDVEQGKVGEVLITTPDGWSQTKIRDACLYYAPRGYTLTKNADPDFFYESPAGKFKMYTDSGGCSMGVPAAISD